VVTRKYKTNNKEPQSKRVATEMPSIRQLQKKKIIVIGVSSGGPQVLHKIFSGITSHFPLPILVVQHISEGFLHGLVNWLGNNMLIPISIARENETIQSGHIYFAPDNCQMGLNSRKNIKLVKQEEKNGICPSVAYLFQSAANEYGEDSIAILLTGMGSDGAHDLKKLRNTGAITIAQDKQSSLVFGMPGTAVQLDAAGYLLNPEEIAGIFKDMENM
ncbi:MAG: CheB methylesterase domain-containing protein, partial [Bacteroidetes bacterium]|nr:CheB methylesterase domain-containing protein [Bacteroidota bacterium]